MSADTSTISKEVAANVLFYFSQGGYEAGSFQTKLMSAIAGADMTNRARLALGFPELVAAVTVAQHEPNGIARLQQIANVEA